MERPEAEFLYGGGLTQQPLGFGIVAGSGGLLRRLDNGRRIEQIGLTTTTSRVPALVPSATG